MGGITKWAIEVVVSIYHTNFTSVKTIKASDLWILLQFSHHGGHLLEQCVDRVAVTVDFLNPTHHCACQDSISADESRGNSQ